MVCHFTILYKFGNRGTAIIKETRKYDYFIMDSHFTSDLWWIFEINDYICTVIHGGVDL